ncbi:MAG: hypothetical protein L3J16_05765 [Anaerolineales bacterium]|nr:hypothetical protein [Anaerolineales bacterium]
MDTRQAIKRTLTGLALLTLTWACLPLNQTETAPKTSPIPPTARPTELTAVTGTATATPAGCTETAGQVQVGEFDADALSQFHIYLPPCYDDDPSRRYPVLYLIHGQGFSDAQWVELGVPQAADTLIASGEIPALIVVMPFDRRSTRLVDDDHFGEVFVTDFIPFIEMRYRILEGREFHAIGGLSRGAGWAFRYGLTRWELFGVLGLHSPVIFYDDAPKAGDWLDAIPPEDWPQIYLDVGDMDQEIGLAVAFGDLLKEKGIPHEWHRFNGLHNEDYWRAHVTDYLRWYGQTMQPAGREANP